MMYEFRTPDGRVVEEWFSMDDAPAIGSSREINGQMCVRLPSRIEQTNERTIHFTSQSLPLDWPYAKRHNEIGQPEFASKHELREALAVANTAGEPVQWDGGKL